MKTEKIKSVTFNNKKRRLYIVYYSGKKADIHYSSLGFRTTLEDAWVDQQTKGKSVGLKLANGRIDYMPYDQPLALIQDPEFLLQTQIEVLIARIKEVLQKKNISKRYLAEKLKTSDNQIQRLLNPKILNKNLPQLYTIVALLNLDLKLNISSKKAT